MGGMDKDCDFSSTCHVCSAEEPKKVVSPPTTALTPLISADLKFQLSVHCGLFYTNTTPNHQPLPDLVLWSHKATFSIIRSRENSSRTLSSMVDVQWEGKYVTENYHIQLAVNNQKKKKNQKEKAAMTKNPSFQCTDKERIVIKNIIITKK